MLNPELRIAIKELIEQTKVTSYEHLEGSHNTYARTLPDLKEKIFNLINLYFYDTDSDKKYLHSNTGEIEQIIKEVFEE